MSKTTNTDAIEALRSFAVANNEIQFAHLCTAALLGEEWAVERVNETIARAQEMEGFDLGAPTANLLHFIWSTDTSRPDGAVPRTFSL